MEDESSAPLDGKGLNNLRVVDLKQELDKRGLSKSGSKKDLVKRLKQQLEFEKFSEERKSSGGSEIKLQLDAATEQNEFVQQYLALQQKRMEEKRLAAETSQKLDKEKSEESDEEHLIIDESMVSETDEIKKISQNKDKCNKKKILLKISRQEKSNAYMQFPKTEKSAESYSSDSDNASPDSTEFINESENVSIQTEVSETSVSSKSETKKDEIITPQSNRDVPKTSAELSKVPETHELSMENVADVKYCPKIRIPDGTSLQRTNEKSPKIIINISKNIPSIKIKSQGLSNVSENISKEKISPKSSSNVSEKVTEAKNELTKPVLVSKILKDIKEEIPETSADVSKRVIKIADSTVNVSEWAKEDENAAINPFADKSFERAENSNEDILSISESMAKEKLLSSVQLIKNVTGLQADPKSPISNFEYLLDVRDSSPKTYDDLLKTVSEVKDGPQISVVVSGNTSDINDERPLTPAINILKNIPAVKMGPSSPTNISEQVVSEIKDSSTTLNCSLKRNISKLSEHISGVGTPKTPDMIEHNSDTEKCPKSPTNITEHTTETERSRTKNLNHLLKNVKEIKITPKSQTDGYQSDTKVSEKPQTSDDFSSISAEDISKSPIQVSEIALEEGDIHRSATEIRGNLLEEQSTPAIIYSSILDAEININIQPHQIESDNSCSNTNISDNTRHSCQDNITSNDFECSKNLQTIELMDFPRSNSDSSIPDESIVSSTDVSLTINSSFDSSCRQESVIVMETSQRSSVPYSLSDIQLPESPGNLSSKSVKDEDKSKKALSSVTKDMKRTPKGDKPNGVSPKNDSASEKSSSESESGEDSSQSDSPEKNRPKKCKGDGKQRDLSNDEPGRSRSDENRILSSTSLHAEDKLKIGTKDMPKSPKISDDNESNIRSDVNKFRKINIKPDKDIKHKYDEKHKADEKHKSDGSKHKSEVSKHKSNENKHKPGDSKHKLEDGKHKSDNNKQRHDGADLKSHSKHRPSGNKYKFDDKRRSDRDKHRSENKTKASDTEQKPCDIEIPDNDKHKTEGGNFKAEDSKSISDDSKSKSDSKDKEAKSEESEEKSGQKPDDGQQNQDEEKNANLKEKPESKYTSQKRESTEDKIVSKSSHEREQTSKPSYSDSEDDQSSDSDTKHRRSDLKHKAKQERDSSSSSSSSQSSPERRHSRRLTSDSRGKNSTKKEQDFHIIDRKSLSKANTTFKKIEMDEPKVGLKNDPPKKRLKIKRDNVTVEKPILKQRQESPPRKSVEVSNLSLSKSETEKPVKLENTETKVEAHEIPYVPRKVSIANRTLSRKSSEDTNIEPRVKKSKWGSIAAAQKSSQGINISTDSLKTWFPDFKLMNEPTTPMELEAEDHSLPAEPELHPQTSQSEALEEGETSDKHAFTSKMDDDEEVEPAKEAIEEDELLESSDATKIIFIQNLVRPFTLNQLKELLKQSGNVIEEYFWIDKIKSKCFVMYETQKEAIKARNALNNTRWPSSNPKILSAQFSNEEELEQHKKGNEPPSRPIPEIKEPSEPREFIKTRDRSDEEPRRKEKERRERNRGQGLMREWDRDKVSQESPEREHSLKEGKSRSSEKKDRKESKKRPSEDTSAKLLDDLFMKTKSTPCIYWLPLTEEQVKAKEDEKLRKKLDREKRIQQKEQEEAERRSRRARSPRRSREKVSRKSSTRSRSPVSRRR